MNATYIYLFIYTPPYTLQKHTNLKIKSQNANISENKIAVIHVSRRIPYPNRIIIININISWSDNANYPIVIPDQRFTRNKYIRNIRVKIDRAFIILNQLL